MRIISLGPPSPTASSSLPGLRRSGPLLVPYLALLQVGFAMRPPSPAARCALTAPFHPCLCPSLGRPGHRRSALCGTFRHVRSASRRASRARALPGTLPCGARTFLRRRGASDTRPLRSPAGDPPARVHTNIPAWPPKGFVTDRQNAPSAGERAPLVLFGSLGGPGTKPRHPTDRTPCDPDADPHVSRGRRCRRA